MQEPTSVVSLLKLLQAHFVAHSSRRWSASYQHLLAKKVQRAHCPELARLNGITYSTLISQWKATGMKHRAEALDVRLERLSRLASSSFPVDEILRLFVLVADPKPTTDLAPRSCYGARELDAADSSARDTVLERSFVYQLGLLSSPIVLPEMLTESDLEIPCSLPTQSRFFHLPPSVHTLSPLSLPTRPVTLHPSTAENVAAFLTTVTTALDTTLWERAATDDAPRHNWQSMRGGREEHVWQLFPSMASTAQFEQMYLTNASDATSRQCVLEISEIDLTVNLLTAFIGSPSSLFLYDHQVGFTLASSRLRVLGASYVTTTSFVSFLLSLASQVAQLRRWAEDNSDPKVVGSVRYALGRLAHRLVTQFSSYTIEFRTSGKHRLSALSLYHYLSPTLPMISKLVSLLYLSSDNGTKLIDRMYHNCSVSLFGRAETTPMVALGYELVIVAVQPLLAFLDALVANPDVEVHVLDPLFEFHVPAPNSQDWIFALPESLSVVLKPINRLVCVLRLLKSVSATSPLALELTTALPDRVTDLPIEAIFDRHVHAPLTAVLKEAESLLLKSLREQHALTVHLDALSLFFLSTNGLFLVALLQASGEGPSASSERILQAALLDAALDSHPCGGCLTLTFGPEMLGATLPMPHLTYRVPSLLGAALNKEALAKYSSVCDFLLRLRWHARAVQQSVSANLKSMRCADARAQAQLLGFALLQSINALQSYALEQTTRFQTRWTAQRASAIMVSELESGHSQLLDTLLDGLFLSYRAAPIRQLLGEFFTQASEFYERKTTTNAYAALLRRRRLLRLVLLKLDSRSTAEDVSSLALAMA